MNNIILANVRRRSAMWSRWSDLSLGLALCLVGLIVLCAPLYAQKKRLCHLCPSYCCGIPTHFKILFDRRYSCGCGDTNWTPWVRLAVFDWQKTGDNWVSSYGSYSWGGTVNCYPGFAEFDSVGDVSTLVDCPCSFPQTNILSTPCQFVTECGDGIEQKRQILVMP